MAKHSLLHPATFKLDGGAMFGIIPKPLWEKAITADEQNRITMSLRVLMIETDNRAILIDSGIGDYHGDKFDERFAINGEVNPLVKILDSKKSLNPDQITDIVLTHLHFDHVGGLGTIKDSSFEPLFKNATLHLSKKHWEYSLNPTMRDAGSFQSHFYKHLIEYYQNSNQINWIESEEGEILTDKNYSLKFLSSHGHTPFQIHPYDSEYIYLADICPMSHHVNIPWVMGYDISPGITCTDKIRIFNQAIEMDLKVIFEHDTEFYGGKLEFDGRKYSLSEKYPASNLKGLQLI